MVVADLAFHQLLGGVQTTKVYTFSGPRVGDSTFAARFRELIQELSLSAWRVFNTEDLVPTLPLSTIAMVDPESKLGLFESKVELLLKLILKEPSYRFQHVDEPVAVTYQKDTIHDNHKLTFLYQHLDKCRPQINGVVREVSSAANQVSSVVRS